MKPLTISIVVLIVAVVGIGIGFRLSGLPSLLDRSESIVVAHWTTGHLTRDGLLKDMAADFNKSRYRTASDKK